MKSIHDETDQTGSLAVPEGPLRDQILAAAHAFATDAQPLVEILEGLVNDVDRALREPLEIVPVCHHSPSSAVHMVRRLAAKRPRVIYMECCEDLLPALEGLNDCTLPVALQAFAPQAEAFPSAWSPLNLVCPLTEFSAEFQAIAYARAHPETELVFVDRSADLVFQWMPREESAVENATPDDPDPDDDEAAMHGSAVGVEVGALVPTLDRFLDLLLKNARVQHFSEWWDQYVEEAVIDKDYGTYRQVMFLIGSLFRRLGTSTRTRESDALRERHMWTRIKKHLRTWAIDPNEAIYICGAAHAASDVPEFGLGNDLLWEIPPPTSTTWHHGLIPSSYSAICHQFGHPRGSLTLAENRWKKGLARQGLRAYTLAGKRREDSTSKEKPAGPKPRRNSNGSNIQTVEREQSTTLEQSLIEYLRVSPLPPESDEEELLQRCVRIVELARRNGYLVSTADSIAIYQTSILLANLRNRNYPTAYDFRDAAITCIDKGVVPGKRDVSRLCDILLGGDRVGRVGYTSLPPLAQKVLEQLAALPISLESRTVQRALLDYRKEPELLPCSDLLWKLRYLLPTEVVRPIMGQRTLGHVPQQESWDLAIGKHQGHLIQLGYEGVTIEHVLERRLKAMAFGPDARVLGAIQAAEDSLLFLKAPRVTADLGERAVDLLVREPDTRQAREIHSRIIRLVHYYRTTEAGLPPWLNLFVTTGYSYYATQLPFAFADRGVHVNDLAAMLQFLFTLESLALSLGCKRSQVVIALRQAASITTDPPKLALLWSAECMLRLREISSLRAQLDAVSDNELTLPVLPEYLEGLLLALVFTPLVGTLCVELLSKAFERLPDRLLMPWLPKLLMMLRPFSDTALPVLLKEASALFPAQLEALDHWQAPWHRVATKLSQDTGPASETTMAGCRARGGPARRGPQVEAAAQLLSAHPATTNALASAMGLSADWRLDAPSELTATSTEHAADSTSLSATIALLGTHPKTLQAVAPFFRN